MNQVNSGSLRIKNAAMRKINLYDTFIVFLYEVCIVFLPVYVVIMQNAVDNKEYFAGELRLKLIHDYTDWYKTNHPASSWVEKDHYINGSDYHRSYWMDFQILGMFVVSFNWNLVATMFWSFIEFFIELLCFLIKKLGWKKMLNYLLIGCIIYLIQTLGILNLCLMFTKLLQNNIIKWMESRIYDATLDMGLFNSPEFYIKHPLQSEPPFHLFVYKRYLKEDAIFTCEYLVQSPQNALPVYKPVNWRKDGKPVHINDRIFVNFSISLNREIMGFNEYSVTSNLTLEMIEDSDFGTYTCEFYNPMVSFIHPGPRMYSKFKFTSLDPTDIGSDFKSQCKPPDEEPPPCKPDDPFRDFGEAYAYKQPRLQCWAEFQLQKREENNISLHLSPGSILIDGATYMSETGEENLEFDVTFSNIITQITVQCCSSLVLLYWRFFREGFDKTPPFGRIIQSDSGFLFLRYQCMCRSSYGTHQLRIHRHFLNHSDGTRDIMEIEYPVKLIVLPSLDNYVFNIFNLTFTDGILECWNTGFASDTCHNFGQLFDSVVNFILKYEMFFAFLIRMFCLPICYILITLCMFTVAHPLLSAYLYHDKSNLLFESIEGPPITNVKPCEVIQSQHIKKKYQFYLSYDHQDADDRQIAHHFREYLSQKHFSVFDAAFDGTPGMPEVGDFCEAIKNTFRFIVLASKSYVDNNVLEFDCIQNALIRENSKIKNRLFVIKTEPCDIDRLQSVPCIEWPIDKIEQMEEFKTFQLWEKATSLEKLSALEVFKDKLVHLTSQFAFLRVVLILIVFIVLILIGGQW